MNESIECTIVSGADQGKGNVAYAITDTFPFAALPFDRTDLVKATTEAIIGSQQVRYGNVPCPESLLAIEQVVNYCVTRSLPIPFLCPFGSKKTLSEQSVDVAELASFRMLMMLNERVRLVYPAGIEIILRVEDLGGYYLFADEGKAVRCQSNQYIHTLYQLFQILGMSKFACFKRDSDFTTEKAYISCAQRLTPVILNFLTDTDNSLDSFEQLSSWKKLSAEGWQGNIPPEQRLYFCKRYEQLYHCDRPAQLLKLAEYLAGSLARYQLKATGENPAWEKKFIHLNFCPPIPGTPKNLASTRLYYRTVPLSFSRNHIAPWRGKGIIKLGGTTPRIAMTSWKEQELYTPCIASLKGNGFTAVIRADYRET